MPTHPHTPRAMGRMDLSSPFQFSGFERYMEPITGVRTAATVSSHVQSKSASRVIPISVSGRANAQQSPAERRDMVAFSKASQAAATAAATSASKPSTTRAETVVKKEVVQERSVKVKEAPQRPVSAVSPMMTAQSVQQKQKADEKSDLREQDKTQDIRQQQGSKAPDYAEKSKGQPEKKVLDTVLMEEIIETVMKPAGLGVDLSNPDSKMTYHVEKTQDEDGTTKTNIVLESKVQEHIDLSSDNALEELLSKGVKTVTLEDIKGTQTASMIQNLIGLGLKEGESMENKKVNIKIIEEPVENSDDEEAELMMSNPEFFQSSSMGYQVEEVENVPKSTEAPTTETAYEGNGSVRIQESSTDMGPSYSSQDQESQDYFVSTPEDNSEGEEGGFGSYGHYGVVDDLSDERYYQEGAFPVKKHYSDESDSFREDPDATYAEDVHSYARGGNIPDCIIEEEVRVSPMVQESVLEILNEQKLDPKQQLKGALEKLQGTVSGSLREELNLLTKGELEGADNVSVDIQKMQQSSDNGTTTIVAQLNVTQSLEKSGLLGEGDDDMSDEQIMAALRSNPELQKAFSGGAQGGYSMKVSREEVTSQGMPWGSEQAGEGTDIMVGRTEKHVKLSPNEQTFTFQMDGKSGIPGAGAINIQGLLQREMGGSEQEGQHGGVKVTQEKRIATVFLDDTEM